MRTFVTFGDYFSNQRALFWGILLSLLLLPIDAQDAPVTMADTTAEPEPACPAMSTGTTPLTINNYAGCGSGQSERDDDCSCGKGLENRIQNLEAQLSILTGSPGGIGGGGGGGGGDPVDLSRRGVSDCQAVMDRFGNNTNGVYVVWPSPSPRPFEVLCEFEGSTAYTVIQARVSGDTTFQRSWEEYKAGFGYLEPNRNMWLGLDKIYYLTKRQQNKLTVNLEDFDGATRFATYGSFSIAPESDRYRLKLFMYDSTSTAGDGLGGYHNFIPFSTFDMDNDYAAQNCPLEHGGGWWYRDCDNANLNGKYNQDPQLKGPVDMGVEWDTWRQRYSLKATKMKISRRFIDSWV